MDRPGDWWSWVGRRGLERRFLAPQGSLPLFLLQVVGVGCLHPKAILPGTAGGCTDLGSRAVTPSPRRVWGVRAG